MLTIFSWYVVRKLGIGEICDRLNRDLDRYPPQQQNRKDENDLPQTSSKARAHAPGFGAARAAARGSAG